MTYLFCAINHTFLTLSSFVYSLCYAVTLGLIPPSSIFSPEKRREVGGWGEIFDQLKMCIKSDETKSLAMAVTMHARLC